MSTEPQRYKAKVTFVEAMQYDGSRESAMGIVLWVGGPDAQWSASENLLITTTLFSAERMLMHKGDWVTTSTASAPTVRSDKLFNEWFERHEA